MILFYIQVDLDKCHIMAKSKLRACLQNRCILSFIQNIETMLWKGGGKSIHSFGGMAYERVRENSGAAIR